MKLTPRALIRQTLHDAEAQLARGNQGNSVVSKADYARLPKAMQTIVDNFKASGKKSVKTADVLGQLRTGLEAAFAQSLKAGHLVSAEVIAAQGLVAGSPMTVAALSATPHMPMGADEAIASVKMALDNADVSLRSQLGTQKTLENALKVLQIENPKAPETKALTTLVGDRATLMRDVAKTELKTAEAAQKRGGGSPAAKSATHVALVAAQEIQKIVNPKSSALKTLRTKEKALGKDAATNRPFFARFLENQNRTGATAATKAVQGPTTTPKAINHHGVFFQTNDASVGQTSYIMRGGVPYEIIAKNGNAKKGLAKLDDADIATVSVKGTLGSLSDPSGGPPRAVIFATDVEQTVGETVELNGLLMKGEGKESGKVFLEAAGRRFEVDPGDAKARNVLKNIPEGGLNATLAGTPQMLDDGAGNTRLVFEAERVDVKGPGTIMVTMKAPSDNEDGGEEPGLPVMVTMKAPSDHEDSGDGGGMPPLMTEKFPSDAEDNAGEDPGVYVTMKAPSDNEDGGDTGGLGPAIFVTMKAPSDHEDGGDGWIGVEPIAIAPPPDAGDGDGAPGDVKPDVPEDGGVAYTRKYPSDNEDGGAGEDGIDVGVTERFPSDAEDIGDGDSMFTTLKAPSDNEDGGVDDPGGIMVTMKAPSDAEDAGDGDTGGMIVTMKFPSDNEDGGDGSAGLPDVTERFPSDSEDIGDGEDGIDIGDMVTMKYPSDNEDGGTGINNDSAVTERYPSDNEDIGDGGDTGVGGAVTAKFPSDNEDSGGDPGDRIYTTMKFPSDNEDGDGAGNGGGVGVGPIAEPTNVDDDGNEEVDNT